MLGLSVEEFGLLIVLLSFSTVAGYPLLTLPLSFGFVLSLKFLRRGKPGGYIFHWLHRKLPRFPPEKILPSEIKRLSG